MAKVLFDSQDWTVEDAPILGWGFKSKGTFALNIQRVSANGKAFPWTMNVPDFMVGNLPAILDAVEEPKKLLFSGGWIAGNASVQVSLAE